MSDETDDLMAALRHATGITVPTVHALIYGDSGAGKSTGAATFPKPMLVFAFDPRGKETPYVRRGVSFVESAAADSVTPVTEVVGKRGTTIIRIEHYHDGPVGRDPQHHPTAYRRFLERLADGYDEIARYATVVVDSVTFMEIAARKYAQYVLNPTAKEPRQWFGFSTDTLEEVLLITFGSLATNVVVLAHIDEDKDEVHGTMLRNPAAPGRLRKRSPAGYSEVWRAFVRPADRGQTREYLWQTQSDAVYNCSTQVGAAPLVVQEYRLIWTP